MNTQIYDGGAAFPEPGVYDASRDQVNPVGAYYDAGGMTIRDYFAAKIAPAYFAYLSGLGDSGVILCRSHEEIAKESYSIADAMLAAREAQS